jgi:hypothetical protein
MGWRALPFVFVVTITTTIGVAACSSHGVVATPLGDDDASVGFDAAHDVAIPSSDALVFVDSAGDDASAQPDVVIPGSCAGQPDGTVCVLSHDPCLANAVCTGGLCGGLTPKPNGTACKAAPDPCHSDATCNAGQCGTTFPVRADGYNWQAGDDTARCCGGNKIHANTDTDCGACGIHCNAGNGESCQLLGGHYFCRGCVASAQCWSHCCSTSFSPYSCAASDCAGSCSSTYCPPGTHCVVGNGTSSDYCAY